MGYHLPVPRCLSKLPWLLRRSIHPGSFRVHNFYRESARLSSLTIGRVVDHHFLVQQTRASVPSRSHLQYFLFPRQRSPLLCGFTRDCDPTLACPVSHDRLDNAGLGRSDDGFLTQFAHLGQVADSPTASHRNPATGQESYRCGEQGIQGLPRQRGCTGFEDLVGVLHQLGSCHPQ